MCPTMCRYGQCAADLLAQRRCSARPVAATVYPPLVPWLEAPFPQESETQASWSHAYVQQHRQLDCLPFHQGLCFMTSAARHACLSGKLHSPSCSTIALPKCWRIKRPHSCRTNAWPSSSHACPYRERIPSCRTDGSTSALQTCPPVHTCLAGPQRPALLQGGQGSPSGLLPGHLPLHGSRGVGQETGQ